MYSVLFVCHGNICRSPMAEAMLKKKVKDSNINGITVDSAGILDYHKGEPPHTGTINILREYGIPVEGLVSRPLMESDFNDFNLIIAMDAENVKNINKKAPKEHGAKIKLLSDYVHAGWTDVPDPWYTGDFNTVYQMLEKAMGNILLEINNHGKDVS